MRWLGSKTRMIWILSLLAIFVLASCAATPGRDSPLGMIVSTAFSPDGKSIAVSTSEGEVALFDTQPIFFRQQFSRESDKQTASRSSAEMIASFFRPLPLAFSPDGKWLAAGGVSGNLVVWDSASGEEKFRVPARGQILDVVFLPDGMSLLSVGPGAVVRAVGNGEVLAVLALPAGVSALSAAVPADGKLLVIGLSSGELAIFDAASHALVHRFTGHQAAVSGLAFSPDGQVLASTAGGYDLRLWGRDAGNEFTGEALPLEPAADAADSMTRAQGMGTLLWLLGTVRGFQLVGAPTLGAPPNVAAPETLLGKAARAAPPHCGSRVAFSADGRYLAASANLMLCPDCIGTLSPAFLTFITDLGRKTTNTVRDQGCALAISPDGRIVATGGSAQPYLLDSATGQRLAK